MALGGLAYVPPLFSGVGALTLVAASPGGPGAALITAGSAAPLLGVMARLLWRTPALFLATMALGVAAWLVGNSLWLDAHPDRSGPSSTIPTR